MKLRQHLAIALQEIDAAEMDEEAANDALVLAVVDWLNDDGVTYATYVCYGESVRKAVVRTVVERLIEEAKKQ